MPTYWITEMGADAIGDPGLPSRIKLILKQLEQSGLTGVNTSRTKGMDADTGIHVLADADLKELEEAGLVTTDKSKMEK